MVVCAPWKIARRAKHACRVSGRRLSTRSRRHDVSAVQAALHRRNITARGLAFGAFRPRIVRPARGSGLTGGPVTPDPPPAPGERGASPSLPLLARHWRPG